MGREREVVRDVRRDDDYKDPPPPRNDRWKEPEPRHEDRSNPRWPSDDVRRTSTRRDEVSGVRNKNKPHDITI